jgi:hypothetical protein
MRTTKAFVLSAPTSVVPCAFAVVHFAHEEVPLIRGKLLCPLKFKAGWSTSTGRTKVNFVKLLF